MTIINVCNLFAPIVGPLIGIINSLILIIILVNNVSYFPFMSIKKVASYCCVLREGYYVIIWLIVKICVFIKD